MIRISGPRQFGRRWTTCGFCLSYRYRGEWTTYFVSMEYLLYRLRKCWTEARS